MRQLAGHEHLSTSGEPEKALLIPICRRRDSNPHGHSPTVFKSGLGPARRVLEIHESTSRVRLFCGLWPVADPSRYMGVHAEEWRFFGLPRLLCRQECRQVGRALARLPARTRIGR